jgi:AAA domain
MYEPMELRWKGPVIELQNDRELGLCHFVTFAEAKKDSVRQKAFNNIQDALRGSPNGLKVGIEVDCRTELTERTAKGLRRLFWKDYLGLALTFMGKQDEADKLPFDETRPPFPVKNDQWESRAEAEATDFRNWRQWLLAKNQSQWQLNLAQQQSVLSLANRRRLSATQGPPGTGKSKTAGAAIAAAVKAGQKILCVASSNAATDNTARAIQQSKPSDLKMKIVRAHVPAAEYHSAITAAPAPELERRGETSARIQRLNASFETLLGEGMRFFSMITSSQKVKSFSS